MQHLAVSGLTAAHLLAFDKLEGEVFRGSFCHTFDSHYGVAYLQFICHWEPVELFKKRLNMVVFAHTTNNATGEILYAL